MSLLAGEHQQHRKQQPTQISRQLKILKTQMEQC